MTQANSLWECYLDLPKQTGKALLRVLVQGHKLYKLMALVSFRFEPPPLSQ